MYSPNTFDASHIDTIATQNAFGRISILHTLRSYLDQPRAKNGRYGEKPAYNVIACAIFANAMLALTIYHWIIFKLS